MHISSVSAPPRPCPYGLRREETPPVVPGEGRGAEPLHWLMEGRIQGVQPHHPLLLVPHVAPLCLRKTQTSSRPLHSRQGLERAGGKRALAFLSQPLPRQLCC